MRVESLEAQNVMSFGVFTLPLDSRLTILVGPNSAGKTNVLNLFDLVVAGLDWAASGGMPRPYGGMSAAELVLDSFARGHDQGVGAGHPIVVRLSVDLTSAWERDLVHAFFQSALISAALAETTNSTQNGPLIATWVSDKVTRDSLAPMYSGTIVLEHPGHAHSSWTASYEFAAGTRRYRWLLAHRRASPPGLWNLDRWSPEMVGTAQQEQLTKLLFGMEEPRAAAGLPRPLPGFDLSKLHLDSAAYVHLAVQGGGGTFDVQLEPHRRFIFLAGIAPKELQTHTNYSLAHVLALVLREGLTTVAEQFRGVGRLAQPLRPAGSYSLEEFTEPVPGREPDALPLRLLRLKNGDENARKRYASVQKLFAALAPGKSFDLSYSAVPANDDRSAEVNITALVRDESDPEPSRELPIFQHGAGTWEALLLAEALADADDRVVLLDEPGPTLHPTWQRLLKGHLGNGPGQVLLVTHSPAMVPVQTADDLHRLVRLTRVGGSTQPRRLPSSIDPQLAAKLIKELSLSADARAMLFARRVVLFEGETELGALPTWFAKSSTAQVRGGPDEHDIAFYSVGSYTNFQTVLTLLAVLGIPWAIVCDGAAFAPVRASDHIFRQTDRAGAGTRLGGFLDGDATQDTMDNAAFEKLVRRARDHGIFTLAKGWRLANKQKGTPGDESIEIFIEEAAPGQLARARKEAGTSKARRGRWVAEITACPAAVDSLYKSILAVFEQKQ